MSGNNNGTITGTNSPNSLTGGNSDQVISGAAGATTNPGAGGAADNDTLLGLGGGDTIYGGGGNDSIDGGAAADLLFGGDGNDTMRPGLNEGTKGDTVDGGAGNDFIYTNDRVKYIEGGAGADTLDVTGFGSGITFTSVPNATNTWIAQLTPPAGTVTISGIEFFTDSGGGISTDPNTVCFAAGTRILTSLGERAVEALRPGDLVATVSGRGAPMKPVLWMGQRRVALAGNPAAEALLPVRIRAGALGEATPHRDLLVSPDHCLLLDGALVPARLLVNGTSVTLERGLAEVTYWHVELESHDAVLAEGAAAESWLDCGNRHWFANADVARMQVDAMLEGYGTGFDEARACAPLLHGGERLAAIRHGIELRAGAAAAPAPAAVRAAVA